MEALNDLRMAAATLLDSPTWAYVQSMAGSNEHADERWTSIDLVPRMFTDGSQVSTETVFNGVAVTSPIMVSPTGAHELCHPGGELETAKGAAAAGALFCYSSFASLDVTAFGASAPGPWWGQIYPLRDVNHTLDYVDRCAEAGAAGLVLTLDNSGSVARARFRNRLRGQLPGSPGNFPDWSWEELSDAIATWIEPELITRVQSRSALPVHVKGILHPDDATQAVDAGVAGIVVSNHGRRQLDGVVPTATALPGVVAAVDGRAPVYVDGGIRSGTDVLRALSLGAAGVGLGRPILWALAVDGAEGVRGLLSSLQSELEQGMAAMGMTPPPGRPIEI